MHCTDLSTKPGPMSANTRQNQAKSTSANTGKEREA